ncbi:MAG: AI-2E family transporter, partial [Actinomycetota bacterium]|nr:AI-2E family transporter [Actinomycetota bacterium]
ITSSIFGIIFRLMTVGLFLFYILADFPRLRAAIGRSMPQDQQKTFDHITQITVDKVGGWVYSRGLLAAISALFHTVVFMLIGLPYPLAMGLWVGVISQFIPTVGTYIAGAVPVIIALLSSDPLDAVWVILAITIYQQIENYLISPRVTKNTMDLHPAIAFGSAIVGASLLGGFGALIALPFAAAVTVFIQEYTHRYDLVKSQAMESPEEYEARIAAKKQAKATKKAAKKHDRGSDS